MKIRWSPKNKKKVFAEIQRLFLAEITKFKRFFRPKSRDLQIKKKVFAEIQRLFLAEITKFKRFFRPKSGVIQIKKKVFAEIRRLFLAEITKFKRFFRPKTATFSSQKNTVGGKKQIGGAKTKIRWAMPPLPSRWRRAWLYIPYIALLPVLAGPIALSSLFGL